MTIWRMGIACWIPKATNIHSEYVILITFPLQQWLHESTSMLRYSTLPVLLYCEAARCSEKLVPTDSKGSHITEDGNFVLPWVGISNLRTMAWHLL